MRERGGREENSGSRVRSAEMGAVGAGWGWGEGRKGGVAGLGPTEQEGARGPGSLQTADGQHMRECPQKNTEAGHHRAAIAIGK